MSRDSSADTGIVVQGKLAEITQTLKRFASLSNILRTVGAAILVTAMSMFLFKGWSSGDDIQRYLLLLGHTLILALTGVVLGYWVKEGKGARLFLALAVVSAIVNFAALGGLVYSQVQWDGGFQFSAGFTHWDAGTLYDALIVSAIGIVLLVPVALTGFLVLSRRSASRFTVLFMIAGFALLAPVRATLYVAALAIVVTMAMMFQFVEARRRDVSLATTEGRFARLALLSMPLLMIGRSIYLYDAGMMMFTVLAAIVFTLLRQISLASDLSEHSRVLLNRMSVLPVGVLVIGLHDLLSMGRYMPHELVLPACMAVGAGLLIEISTRSPRGGALYRQLAGLVATLVMLINLWVFGDVVAAMIAIVTGVAVTAGGYSGKHRLMFVSGLATVVVGLGYQFHMAFRAFDLGSWGTLATAGVLTIVAASLLERYGVVLKDRLGRWRQSFRQW